MNPVRMLGKMTAKGLRLDGGVGGPVLVPPSDVAAALGLGALPRPALLVGLAKYSDDNQCQLALRDWAAARFRARCERRGWKTDYCGGIALLCVYELVNPTRCPHCLGKGTVWKPSPAGGRKPAGWGECGRCKGSGNVRLSLRDRAAIAQISKSRFAETWAWRADQMLAELSSLEEQALRHLWHQFRDDVA